MRESICQRDARAIGILSLARRPRSVDDSALPASPSIEPGTAELTIRELLARLTSGEAGHAAGTTAALVGAAAASMVAMAAGRSRASWTAAGGVAAQATVLQARCLYLAGRDAEAFALAKDALQRGSEIEDPVRETVDVLLTLADAASDVAALAAHTAEHCDRQSHADVVAAAALAESAVRVVGILVAANLTVTAGDESLVRVARALEAATESAGRAARG
jgi:formiminotetrahydrofolate cyclodeaminase